MSPNLIGGDSSNNVMAGASGATIGGGGANDIPNRVTDEGGTVAGGAGNQAGDGDWSTMLQGCATVGGGINNTASGGKATAAM